jgi:hypothetical protein
MKTLKQFMEETGYLKVKSPDEQKFIDKHKTDTIPDANGNGDEVFKASNVKKVPRKAERKGYEPGEDEKVYEEVEELDELSKKTLRSYRSKRSAQRADAKDELEYHFDAEFLKRAPRMSSDSPEDRERAYAYHNALRKDINKMSTGIKRASAKIRKEELDEAERGYKSDSPRRGRRYGPMDRKPIKLMRKKKKAIDKLAKEEFTQSIEALSPRLQEAMVSVHDRLSEENRQKFVAACQTEEGLEKMVAFALENRGV